MKANDAKPPVVQRKRRKFGIVSILLSVLLLTASGVVVSRLAGRIPDKESACRKILSEIRKTYAPDRRDRTFDVRLSHTGDGTLAVTGSTTEPEALEAARSRIEASRLKIPVHITLLPDTAVLGDRIYGVSRLSSASLRYGADYSSEMASQLPMGTPVRILEKHSYWYRIVTPEGYTAWTTVTGIAAMDSAGFAGWRQMPKVMVTADFSRLREEPSEQAATVSDAILGNILGTTGTVRSGFLEVCFPDGRTAWIPRQDAADYDRWLARRQPDAAHILKTARLFTGYPYLWGGTTTKAMDCSGFTKTVFFLNGIILRRDASQQARTGEAVDLSKGYAGLQPADLIFFGRKATPERKESITHVGIYLGDGLFIHAASKVRINSLDPASDLYYEGADRLVRARRILGCQDRDPGIVSLKEHPWYTFEPMP